MTLKFAVCVTGGKMILKGDICWKGRQIYKGT